MNNSSQWRMQLAQQVGAAYASNPKVAAVMAGGSTARGHADRFSIAPEAFPSRFKGLYKLGPQYAAEGLAHLVEETYDLVEQRAPDVDVKWLRSVLRWQRPIWEEPPPQIEL